MFKNLLGEKLKNLKCEQAKLHVQQRLNICIYQFPKQNIYQNRMQGYAQTGWKKLMKKETQ